ncbi:hypothetical protein LA080_001144 [Diaporthe eres]|nr:hypothetical protein LA080_001144 [Diaporthe eres]
MAGNCCTYEFTGSAVTWREDMELEETPGYVSQYGPPRPGEPNGGSAAPRTTSLGNHYGGKGRCRIAFSSQKTNSQQRRLGGATTAVLAVVPTVTSLPRMHETRQGPAE